MKIKPKLELPAEGIKNFCNRWKVKEFSLFGSVLRKDFRPESDVDVLLSFHDGAQWGLFEFVDMKEELEKIFGREVDIIEKEGIKNPFRLSEIIRSREVIYGT